ncbi:hypothetical protein PSA01_43620 [Pseudonocardia saturnea]|uniref:Uncharacterized protein n=1 Tax=Pseudonocardia saturnea TaxID=33909 RepID=A0ABQ0S345_9PSEU|nr:hypothetical protein Pdca_50760 [Pseudonocardia autotrophica]GEC27333.1 hypothetical protein PSA01_43620 [Pseudonocardia saturnea]
MTKHFAELKIAAAKIKPTVNEAANASRASINAAIVSSIEPEPPAPVEHSPENTRPNGRDQPKAYRSRHILPVELKPVGRH